MFFVKQINTRRPPQNPAKANKHESISWHTTEIFRQYMLLLMKKN